jgi:hypothetical protein
MTPFELGSALGEGTQASIAALSDLRVRGRYGDIQDALFTLPRPKLSALLTNAAFWQEMHEIIHCPSLSAGLDAFTLLASAVPSAQHIKPDQEHLYVNIAVCFSRLLGYLSGCGSYKQVVAQFIMNRCSLRPFALAMVNDFPSLIYEIKHCEECDKGPKSYYGQLITILSNLATCEDVTAPLRDLGVADLVTPLLSYSTSVMRVLGMSL